MSCLIALKVHEIFGLVYPLWYEKVRLLYKARASNSGFISRDVEPDFENPVF